MPQRRVPFFSFSGKPLYNKKRIHSGLKMIQFIGDVHRSFNKLEELLAASDPEISVHIQLGDLGVRPLEGLPPGTKQLELPKPLYFIDGNWDYYPWLRSHEAPVEILPNLIFVPRGTILTLDDRRVAFLGGAQSVTRYRRTEGINWWPDEEKISMEDVDRFKGKRADILVTHAPPASITRRIFDKGPSRPGLPSSTNVFDAVLEIESGTSGIIEDITGRRVAEAWRLLGHPTIVSGHLHRSAHFPDKKAHVLGELETLLL